MFCKCCSPRTFSCKPAHLCTEQYHVAIRIASARHGMCCRLMSSLQLAHWPHWVRQKLQWKVEMRLRKRRQWKAKQKTWPWSFCSWSCSCRHIFSQIHTFWCCLRLNTALHQLLRSMHHVEVLHQLWSSSMLVLLIAPHHAGVWPYRPMFHIEITGHHALV